MYKQITIDGIDYNLVPVECSAILKHEKSKPKFKIGDSYLNGIVAYIDETGEHGLVCAKADYFEELNWHDAMKIFENTSWRLPTKEELYILYKNKDMLGGFATYYYWSSSEGFNNGVWSQYFYNGLQSYLNKSNTYYVRAVRAF